MTNGKSSTGPKKDSGKTNTERAVREYRTAHEEVFAAREAMQRSKLARAVGVSDRRSDYGYHHLP